MPLLRYAIVIWSKIFETFLDKNKTCRKEIQGDKISLHSLEKSELRFEENMK